MDGSDRSPGIRQRSRKYYSLCLRANHELEWPDDVKQAARQVQLTLNVANGTGFKGSQALQDLLAADWADFQAKLEAWRYERDRAEALDSIGWFGRSA